METPRKNNADAAYWSVSKYDEIACFWICSGTSTSHSLHVHLTAGNVTVEAVSSHLLGYWRSWLNWTWASFKQCVKFLQACFQALAICISSRNAHLWSWKQKYVRVFKSACVCAHSKNMNSSFEVHFRLHFECERGFNKLRDSFLLLIRGFPRGETMSIEWNPGNNREFFRLN